ncbi:MAG: lactonase family protein [Nitrospinae bacterium]|nr:lactonase family protein [Nitrospinota bacterium]
MPYCMYVSVQGEDKIVRFTMDPDTGQLQPQGVVEVSGGPAPLAVDPARQFLYVARRGERKISSFRIDPHTGALSMIGTEVSLETDPCYLATDRRGKFLLSSYYEGSGVTVHPIGDDGGAYGPAIEWRPTARGAHSIQTDPSNQFAFVPHIAGRGPNEIWQFRFDARTGHLTPNTPAKVIPEGELGPRHFCFHPRKNILYFSNEQGCSVTAYQFDASAGTLTAMQTVSTLPDDFVGRNSCSQIQIAPSGKFLYAPNRGHNSIACFTVDAATGMLTQIGCVPSETVPRAFSLDPTGRFLFAAGLESGRLAAYRIDADSGALQPLQIYPVGARPMWVLITHLAG